MRVLSVREVLPARFDPVLPKAPPDKRTHPQNKAKMIKYQQKELGYAARGPIYTYAFFGGTYAPRTP